MPVDKVLVKRKLSLISEDLIRLKSISKLSFAEYIDNFENEILAERYLERIIGRMIDINYHIVTEMGRPAPRDYYNSFIELGKLKVVSPALSHELAGSAGLRNHISHEYDDIDEKKIYAAVKNCFTGLPKYLNSINSFLKKKLIDPR